MFDFKFNITAIKIILILILVTFFLPFFAVSCGSKDLGVNFSGFELSTGKYIQGNWYNGNFIGFIIILFPVILLILSFFIHKIKKITVYNILKIIFFIAPIFDIFVVFIVKYAFNAVIIKTIYDKSAETENIFLARGISEIAKMVKINIKSGFVFYIILNAAAFIFAAINYFVKRE